MLKSYKWMGWMEISVYKHLFYEHRNIWHDMYASIMKGIMINPKYGGDFTLTLKTFLTFLSKSSYLLPHSLMA